jgi:hypothetical protein
MTAKAETTGFNDRLFERMQDMNRTWIERLREIRQIESDFGSRLLRAGSSSEAANICHEWMAKRLEAVAYEQRTFTTAWLALISDTMKMTRSIKSSGQNTQRES